MAERLNSKNNIISQSYDAASKFYGENYNKHWEKDFFNLREFVEKILLSAVIKKKPKAKILDIGCGTGTSSQILLELYPDIQQIVGIDISAQMLNKAESNLGEKFIGLHGDIKNLKTWEKINEKFDGIISFFVFHWIEKESLTEIIKIVHDKLKPSGWFVGAAFGQFEMGKPIINTITDILRIYTKLDKHSIHEIMNTWNGKNSLYYEKILYRYFGSAKITSFVAKVPLTDKTELLAKYFHRYGFWASYIPFDRMLKAQKKFLEILYEEWLSNGFKSVFIPQHIISWEAFK